MSTSCLNTADSYAEYATDYFGFANGSELPAQYNDAILHSGQSWVALGFPYDSLQHPNLTSTYLPAITNSLQLLISAVRLDFGHILPNNPFLNMSVMNETLQDPFPPGIPPDIYQIGSLGDPENISEKHMTDFLSRNSSTYINGEYQCRFWYSVGWGECPLVARSLARLT